MGISISTIDKVLGFITFEKDAVSALDNIIGIGRAELASDIWNCFDFSDIENDISFAQKWIQKSLISFPSTTGIYVGLDTLNMDNGTGTNVEIGLSSSCDPKIFNDDWVYDCDYYGDGHLIKGLSINSECFNDEINWTSDERSFSKYLIFLGYSGIIFREALFNIKTINDFLAIWGFHDGDIFYLVNRRGKTTSVVANVDI